MAYVPLTMSHSGISAIRITAYFCYDCNYEYAPIGGMKNHHLYKKLSTGMYRWSYDETTQTARVWYIGKPGVPGESPNEDLKLLKSFEDNHSDVNPDNVEEKLKLVLTFL